MIILVICSIILDITWGNICCFPKKYDLIIPDSDINGKVKLIAIIGYIHLVSWRRFVAKYLEDKIKIVITSIFIIIDIGNVDAKIFLLLYLSSDINFEIDNGRLNWVMVIAKEKVGSINVYILIPSIPIYLVVIIFINKPNSLVIKPPIIR